MGKTRAKGVIAAGHELTAEAGAAVLRDGGTAIDAAITALAMACVSEPVLCSPGGGGFAMVRDGASGQISLVDFFPQTPLEHNPGIEGIREVHADFGPTTQGFHIGPATAATPGFSEGLMALHDLGATMSMAEMIAPAVAKARAGVRITPFQHYLATVVAPIITATADAAALYAPDGDLLKPGELLRNPGLADGLESLAAGGFIGSDVGVATIALQRDRGHLTSEDLAAYEPIRRTPLAIPVGDSTVHMNPLPAASGELIRFALANMDSSDPVDIARSLDVTDVARRDHKSALAQRLSTPLRQKGTTHISVIDANGNACSVTTSNGEGNGELVDGFGFMLNNVLGEEDVNPAGMTGWPTNTRLSSMMCPTLIEGPDGSIATLGSGGSNRIRSAIGQAVIRLCLDGAGLEEAIVAPRLHVERGHLDFEDLYDQPTREALADAFADNRPWPEPNLFFGGVHAVEMDPKGRFVGIGDTRRDGAAIAV